MSTAALAATEMSAAAAESTSGKDTVMNAGCTGRHWWSRRRVRDEWVTRCRDEADRRRRLFVVLTCEGRVALVVPPGRVAVLNLLTVGELRAVLREAVFALDDPGIQRPHMFPVPITGNQAHAVEFPGIDERRHRPGWLSRLFCHRKPPVDVGCATAPRLDAPTPAGVQPSAGAASAPRGGTAPGSAPADAPCRQRRHLA